MQRPEDLRRMFLQAAGLGLATLGFELVRRNFRGVIQVAEANRQPLDPLDVIEQPQNSAGFTRVASQALLDDREQGPYRQPEEEVQKDFHAHEYNLWDTIRLNNPKYPIALFVFLADGRVITSSVARPYGFSEDAATRFDNPSSFSTLSFIPWERTDNNHHSFTWAHAGILGQRKLFMYNLERALRFSPNGAKQTTEQIITSSKNLFEGAQVFLCQAQYDDGFDDFSTLPVDKALERFRGNILTMQLSSALRVPPSYVPAYEENVGDPFGWIGGHTKELGGFGWTDPKRSSRWHILTCAGSSLNETDESGKFSISAGRWALGFDLIDRTIAFDPLQK